METASTLEDTRNTPHTPLLIKQADRVSNDPQSNDSREEGNLRITQRHMMYSLRENQKVVWVLQTTGRTQGARQQ